MALRYTRGEGCSDVSFGYAPRAEPNEDDVARAASLSSLRRCRSVPLYTHNRAGHASATVGMVRSALRHSRESGRR